MASERAAAVREAFAAAGAAADEAAHDTALNDLADALAAHCDARASTLAATEGPGHTASFWRRLFLGVLDELDAHRSMGRISGLDELYRAFAVWERVAGFVRDATAREGWSREAEERLDRYTRHQMRLAERAPPGELLPDPLDGLAGEPWGAEREDPVVDRAALGAGSRRRRAENRVRRAIETWAEALAGKSAEERRALDEAMAVSRREHRRLGAVADRAAAAGLVTGEERAAIDEVLGVYQKENGGWGGAAGTAEKVAVTGMIADLHGLLGMRGATGETGDRPAGAV